MRGPALSRDGHELNQSDVLEDAPAKQGDRIDEYVGALGSDLIRFCEALAGVAGDGLAAHGVAAVNERKVRRGEQPAHRAVLRRVVRRYLRGNFPSGVAGVDPAAWAAAVLVVHEDVAVGELRWFLGRDVRPAAVEVPLPFRRPAPEDLGRRGRAAVKIQRRERRRRGGLIATGLVLLLLLGIGVHAVLTHKSPPGVAEGGGLIKWEPRGDLLLDKDLQNKAAKVWKKSVSNRLKEIQTLWAGHVGDGKLVVLQGYDAADDTPQVAAVGLEPSGLALLRSDPMPLAPDLLVIPYDGLRDLALSSYSDGARIVRVLVDPAARMERRALNVKALSDVDKLGPWLSVQPHDGLSEPWVDLTADFATTALRDRGTYYLLDENDSLLPKEPQLHQLPAQLRADADQVPDADQITDDVLAIEQYAFVPDVDARLVWSGYGTSDSTSIRLYNLVPRPGCPDDCDRGLWAVAGTDGIANAIAGRIQQGAIVIELDDLVAVIGPPGAHDCNLSGPDVHRLSPAHLDAPAGENRSFVCHDGRGHVMAQGTFNKLSEES